MCVSQGSPEKQSQQNVYIEKEIYYEQLAPGIMEADKSHDVQPMNWGPRRVRCVGST